MSGLSVGDLVILKSEEEIVWDDSFLEWDHTLIFPSREDARDMRITGGTHLDCGTVGTVLRCDSNFVLVHSSGGTGWSRLHYWRVIT